MSEHLTQALELVRAHQNERFIEMTRGLTVDEHAKWVDAVNIMHEHGDRDFFYKTTCEKAVLLSFLLSQIGAVESPDLEQARQNFIIGVAQTVERVSPVLAAMAMGQVGNPKLASPCQTT